MTRRSLLRCVLSLLVAVSTLWSFFGAPVLGAVLAGRALAAGANVPAATHHMCAMCDMASHAAGKRCCCDTTPADPNMLCFRALCGPSGAPDATLPGVSPCPPAVLPAARPAAPAPTVRTPRRVSMAARPAASSSPALSGVDRPPRLALS